MSANYTITIKPDADTNMLSNSLTPDVFSDAGEAAYIYTNQAHHHDNQPFDDLLPMSLPAIL